MKHSPVLHNERVLFSILALLSKPRSLLDVGSGNGAMVTLARSMGIYALGVDLQAAHPDIQHDLTRPLQLEKDDFDMILCLETAEHLPEEAAWTLCETISYHRHANSRLVFSAALPGQTGEGHLNLQPPVYWRQMLYEAGKWSYRDDLTAKLSLILTHTAGPMAAWLATNTQVF